MLQNKLQVTGHIGQHRKFPRHARKTSGTQGTVHSSPKWIQECLHRNLGPILRVGYAVAKLGMDSFKFADFTFHSYE